MLRSVHLINYPSEFSTSLTLSLETSTWLPLHGCSVWGLIRFCLSRLPASTKLDVDMPCHGKESRVDIEKGLIHIPAPRQLRDTTEVMLNVLID